MRRFSMPTADEHCGERAPSVPRALQAAEDAGAEDAAPDTASPAATPNTAPVWPGDHGERPPQRDVAVDEADSPEAAALERE